MFSISLSQKNLSWPERLKGPTDKVKWNCEYLKIMKMTSANELDLQQETFSTWCKDSNGNPRGHTFASVNCKTDYSRLKKIKNKS